MKISYFLVVFSIFLGVTSLNAACPTAKEVAEALAGQKEVGTGPLDYAPLYQGDQLGTLSNYYVVDSKDWGTDTASYLRRFIAGASKQKPNESFSEETTIPNKLLQKYKDQYNNFCYYTGTAGIQKFFFLFAKDKVTPKPSILPKAMN
jgi:hypothetical protein